MEMMGAKKEMIVKMQRIFFFKSKRKGKLKKKWTRKRIQAK